MSIFDNTSMSPFHQPGATRSYPSGIWYASIVPLYDFSCALSNLLTNFGSFFAFFGVMNCFSISGMRWLS